MSIPPSTSDVQAHSADDLAEQIAQRCKQFHKTSTGWQACCPVHEDTTPSLSITPSTDRVLLKCHADCRTQDVVQALGLTLAALFCTSDPSNGHKLVVKVYDYYDAQGTLLHQTVRYEPKAFKQRRPDPVHVGKYLWRLQGIEPVLYHLPTVLAAVQSGKLIYLVEGEKDADALQVLGLVATCNPMGAGKWRTSYTETLRDAHVVILSDNDAPGRKHCAMVAQALEGTARTVKVLELPNLPDKGDVSDWLAAGETHADLEALVDGTPVWTPLEDAKPTETPLDVSLYGPAKLKARDPDTLPYSDYTNALAFISEYGHNLRYCYPWKTWLVWTGTHWERDTSGKVMRWAKQTIKKLARHIENLKDKADIDALLRHVKKSLSAASLKAMIELAQSEEGIPVQPDDFDVNPWLLNCKNGTLELETGQLRPHTPMDLLTRCLDTVYDSQATCSAWKAFLWRIMGANQNLIDFLQRAVGYALTGVIREHILLILWGKGRNGKSTFLNTLRALLGPYAMKAPSELLMVSNNDRHPTERADLCGKRFVSAIETEQGRRLAEVFVKEATGGDPIRARRMREDFWEFQPTHKVFLATNHQPIITGTDNAIWERIRLVPFGVTIPKAERNTALPETLHGELPGILAWAVHGCLAWQKSGVGEPVEIEQATADYRQDMDLLGKFLEQCCKKGEATYVKIRSTILYDTYASWAGAGAVSASEFTKRLEEQGYRRERGTGNHYYWQGITPL